MTPAGSGGGGRTGRRAPVSVPVKVERLKRRQLARVKTKQYDRTRYDGHYQEQEHEGF
jgi:hypothetical protein